MQLTTAHVLRFIEYAADAIKQQRDYLTRLDAAIGDADHGTNLDRGFSAVLTKLSGLDDRAHKDIGTILKLVGATLVSTVGGASGPLYGTAFLRAGTVTADKLELSAEETIAMLQIALDGIQARGKAQRGEKTMIDAIAPGIDALKQAHDAGDDFIAALRKGVTAAEEGMRATIDMLATKGRASYLGERSIGHQDPGATSAFLLAQALLRAVEGV